MFGKIKTKLLIPAKETPNMGSKQFNCQSHCCISNEVKAKLSRKFHREMMLFASTLAKPMKICACLFLFDKPIKHLRSVLTFIFQGHMKVALTINYCEDLTSPVWSNMCA